MNATTPQGDEILEFANVLDEAGVFLDTSEVILYFEKPWKWEAEFGVWRTLGSPHTSDTRWPEFLERI